ncbi:MAG TPA: SWIM zinc finger family protein, partial [Caldilineaceae bacterium]|nr:SWIM zinc finger family protein [Caldilineaceae bacterium]
MAESTPFHLTEATVREMASAEVFRRGRSYFRSGHVKSLVRRGAAIEAAVKGSMPFPYQVVLEPSSGGGVLARCTCPYVEEGWGGWCKHAVAAALAYLERGDQLPVKPTLEETLAATPADHLRRLLLEWGRGSPELAQRIELWLARIQAQEEALRAAAGLAAADPTGEIEHFVQRLRTALARAPQPQPPARAEAWPDPDDEGSGYEYSEYDVDDDDDVDGEGEWLMWPEGTLGADLITLFDEVMALAVQGRPAQTLAVLAAIVPILLNEPAVADGLALATAYGA